MSTSPDLGERLRDLFLEQERELPPDRLLRLTLAAIDDTAQRRGRVAWRPDRWSVRLVLVAAVLAALVLVPLGIGHQWGLVGEPAPSPLPSPRWSLPPTACPGGEAPASGGIATIAGDGSDVVVPDGARALDGGPSFGYSAGWIAVDPSGAILYTDSQQGSVRRIGTDGVLSSLTPPRTFSDPGGIALEASGDILVADALERIVRVSSDGATAPVAGTGVSGSTGNDGPATAAWVNPATVVVGPRGELYFDDLNNYRTIDPAGIIHAFAGSTTVGFSGDGGPAVDALFGIQVMGVAVDADGVVYLGDPGNHRIRRVGTDGIITTIAGTGRAGFSGDGGPALLAAIGAPESIVVDPAGGVVFSDPVVNRIRRIGPDGIISTLAGTGVSGFSGDCGPATLAQLSRPTGLAIRDGVIYVVDSANRRIRILMP